jgi:hypothetical protein
MNDPLHGGQTNAASLRQPGQFEQVIDVTHLIFPKVKSICLATYCITQDPTLQSLIQKARRPQG